MCICVYIMYVTKLTLRGGARGGINKSVELVRLSLVQPVLSQIYDYRPGQVLFKLTNLIVCILGNYTPSLALPAGTHIMHMLHVILQ